MLQYVNDMLTLNISYFHSSTMSSDIKTKKEMIGVRVSPQLLAKIDERIEERGGTRSEVVRDILKDTLF